MGLRSWICGAPPPKEDAPKKKTRTVTVDDKRTADVLSRHVRWQGIRDNPRHLDAIRYIGITSPMGEMSTKRWKEEYPCP